MEHGGDVVEADQGGLAGGGLGEVADIVDHRPCAEELGLADIVAHPGAARLVVPLPQIEIHQAQLRAVVIEHLEHHHIGVIDGNVGAALEGDAVEPGGGIEHTILQNLVDLEIGLQRRFIQVIAFLAHLLGIALPVPGLEGKGLALLVDRGLDQPGLFGRLGAGRRHQLGDEFLHRL